MPRKEHERLPQAAPAWTCPCCGWAFGPGYRTPRHGGHHEYIMHLERELQRRQMQDDARTVAS